MASQSDYFIIMNGTLGTLAEASLVWNIAALGDVGGYASPLILCYRKPWEAAFTALSDTLSIPVDHRYDNLRRAGY
jgi:predicted Rossmann-fold nucleotide-binding protein